MALSHPFSRRTLLLACAALLCAFSQSCDDSEATDTDATTDTSSAPVELSGVLQGNRTLASGQSYVLKDIVYITIGTLTIEPGVTLRAEAGAALVITRSAQINAVGTPEAPIVFTSAATAPKAGDWGGLILLGDAPINAGTGESVVDGLDTTERYNTFGGTNTAHDCGTLQYARVEFAGSKIDEFVGFNGLTIGGCSEATVLDHIQVHAAAEDGIEFLGGSANIAYAVITATLEDAIDFSLGWTGKVQFLVIQQPPNLGDQAIEGDNNEDDHDATPRANPTIFNATILGARLPTGIQRALLLRRGAIANIANAIVMGFPYEAIDLRDTSTIDQLRAGALTIKSTLFFEVGADGQTASVNDADDDGDDDGAFDENAFAKGAIHNNIFGQDPKLPDPYATTPKLVPPADSPAASAGLETPDADAFFKAEGSTFLGAFKPGAEDWTTGWTAYP